PMAPVVTLHVPILQITEARTGETVGYGASHSLARNSKLAILGHGYADGFFRSLSGSNMRPGGKVFIRGALCPVLGKVSMDQTVVDVTELGQNLPLPGEGAEIFGANIPVDAQADAAGTIAYALLTALTGGYSRNYIGDVTLPEG